MASIALRQVTVRSRGHTVLDEVSLEVPAATSLAILGLRGAGKTTLLRTLAGLRDHAGGDVLIGDQVVNLADPRSRRLALAPDDPRLHPRLDVFDNLAFAAALEPGADDTNTAAAVSAVADLLALGDLMDVRADALDAAQRQRVALGRELVRDCPGYLFDDVFSAQPERVRPHLRSLVDQWQRSRHRTSIHTTETVEDALALGDQVAILHRGELRQSGTPREVYEHPDDVVAASLLGNPPINLLPAHVAGARLMTALGPWSSTAWPADRLARHSSVILGVRPEHVRVGGGTPSAASAAAVVFTARVGAVEWRGADQLLYLACPLPQELSGVVSDLEDLNELDLFQEFIVARVPAEVPAVPGQDVRVAIAAEHVHIFDSCVGFDIALGER
jgi:multiple sugar transport system ATP-binding protein